MGLLGGFFNDLQKVVNDSVGNDYRKIYFSAHPEEQQECACCGATLYRGDSDFTIDHIIPQKYNGTNFVTNLQPMCRSCNSRKKDKIDALTLKYSGTMLINEIKNLNRKKEW
ncbi:HNH endonuclease [bacterium D16-51]|nr:HNH endonuclease [bacterium D16-59]RKI52922.1 HNH endonuclease [bacterium D16-51]